MLPCLNDHITRWRPDTCACIIEYDDNINWRKTIHKCKLHQEFSGKSLLREVLKHNRECNLKGKPDTIEGVLGVDIEPDWLKQVKEYPSNEKLEETRFNLNQLKAYSPMSREFQFCLSNFLSSSSSVLWYLLNEYSRKYRLEIDKYRKDKKYKEARQELISEEAKAFLSWYDFEFTVLQNDTGLLEKRDINIHKGYVESIFRVRQPFKVGGSAQVNLPIDWSGLHAFFTEKEDTNVIQLCQRHLDQLKSLVERAHERFPLYD
jgi:hypothetical protein